MQEAIRYLIENYARNISSRDELEAAKRAVCKRFGLKSIINADILSVGRNLGWPQPGDKGQALFLKLLRKRSIRTLSGIAPVAVLTKPYPCPGRCAYCPHEPDVPVSYLSNEPAVMRAIRCGYDPYIQVIMRLKALEANGHEPNKIEIIVIGGTWSYLPEKYKYWYILNCFRAANDFKIQRKKLLAEGSQSPKSPYKQSLSLEVLKRKLRTDQKKNENAAYRIIGLTLETRPDYLNEAEARQMRELGCTRVEIGVQAIDDKILAKNRRGHGIKEIAEATAKLKHFGFKVTYHFMPALPGSSPTKDLAMFKALFSDESFQPDQIKFYPTVVTKGSLLYQWYKQKKYRPYSDKVLQRLIAGCKAVVPRYVRIIRLVRDIPGESIIAGNKITNLRQVMKDQGVSCQCIRCREAKDTPIGNYALSVVNYPASGGREYFISADSRNRKILYGFCRLRLDVSSPIAPALIRELHVYGELRPVGSSALIQHSGLGKKLLAKAEAIARQAGAEKIAVISGVGVRGYYRKLGYVLRGSYMYKTLT